MNKEHLLKRIAETGYNAGFGAKMSFASFDILRLAPGVISFFSIVAGILGLAYEPLSSKHISVVFLILGILSLYISLKLAGKQKFEDSGASLTSTYRNLGHLYSKVSSTEDVNDELVNELKKLSDESDSYSISDQIFLSSWWAHLKFFGEGQPNWVVDELQLTFWKDKVPSSFKTTIYLTIPGVIIFLILFKCS